MFLVLFFFFLVSLHEYQEEVRSRTRVINIPIMSSSKFGTSFCFRFTHQKQPLLHVSSSTATRPRVRSSHASSSSARDILKKQVTQTRETQKNEQEYSN